MLLADASCTGSFRCVLCKGDAFGSGAVSAERKYELGDVAVLRLVCHVSRLGFGAHVVQGEQPRDAWLGVGGYGDVEPGRRLVHSVYLGLRWCLLTCVLSLRVLIETRPREESFEPADVELLVLSGVVLHVALEEGLACLQWDDETISACDQLLRVES